MGARGIRDRYGRVPAAAECLALADTVGAEVEVATIETCPTHVPFDDGLPADPHRLANAVTFPRHELRTGVTVRIQERIDTLQMAISLPGFYTMAVDENSDTGLVDPVNKRFALAAVEDDTFAYLVTRRTEDNRRLEYGGKALRCCAATSPGPADIPRTLDLDNVAARGLPQRAGAGRPRPVRHRGSRPGPEDRAAHVRRTVLSTSPTSCVGSTGRPRSAYSPAPPRYPSGPGRALGGATNTAR